MGDGWEGLRPDFAWRPSQRHLLDLAAQVTDRRWHLCAPPGAGKTLIGLELARHVGLPTLVLSPTTAIRDQWRDSTARFGADPGSFTSDDPDARVPLRSATYQLLGNPGQAAEDLRAAARRLWVAEVEAEVGADAAATRVAAVEQGDARRAGRELSRHVRALRRSLATGEDVGVPRAQLVGERTSALIDRMAAGGLGCVVLDECHHLLDWWALVVAVLIERLEQAAPVAVVGLTATLPDPGTAQEARNYAGLLGEVDAELHLAAMVAEGSLAPWRDGIRLVPLASDEARFVASWADALAADLDELLVGEAFIAWAVAQIEVPAMEARTAATELDGLLVPDGAWDRFWDRDPLAAAALARWWQVRGLSLPAEFEPPPGTVGTLTVQDRVLLLDAWLHALESTADEDARRQAEATARRHGVAFTTRGVRWGRSSVDLVCSRSAAKGPAAAAILGEEWRRRGDRMRALVVVERDRAAPPPAAARAVLGDEAAAAGTAAQVLAALCADQGAAEGGVVAVTGRGAWCDALGAERIVAAVNVAAGDGRWVSAEGCDVPAAVALVGHGGSWSSARLLAAAEAALDDGAAHVLLASRGLVGEGWDHPPINVLVDLSEAASAAATTQLRGRAIRLDTADPGKVASIWDVVVADPTATGDWDRVRRRHRRWWGPEATGHVVTGPAKVHERLALPTPPDPAEVAAVNAASAARMADVEATRAAWAALDPAGLGQEAVSVRPMRRLRVRTRPAAGRGLHGGAAATALAAVGAGVAAATVPLPILWPVAALGAAAAAVALAAGAGRDRGQDATLGALADGVRAGLVASGIAALARGTVLVEPEPAGGSSVTVVGVDEVAAAAWADAFAEAIGPLGTPRWMVVADDRAWRVPASVGATREGAEAFLHAFRRRVPGARLLRAGEPEATTFVLAAAASRPDEVDRSLRWR